MSAHSWAVQQALYALLAAGHLNSFVGTRIYDDAPQNVEFPYIEIGDRQSIPDDTTAVHGGSDDGVSDFFDIHIWSRYDGKKELDQITDALHTILHGERLEVSGRSSALAWIRTVRMLRDPDGRTRHAVVSVEIIHRT